MCLEHHDWYDSVTSQSKGPRPGEARYYRDELYSAMAAAMAKPITIGSNPVTGLEVAGHYEGGNPEVGASLDIIVTGPNNARVIGFAYYGASRPHGPNIGFLEFDVTAGNLGVFSHLAEAGGFKFEAKFEFVSEGLIVTEAASVGYFGHNVSFGRHYRKVGPARLPRNIAGPERQ